MATWSVRSSRRRDADPFEALGVQLALARLDREIEAIRRDDHAFARAHHLRAALLAYDDLLAEACVLAGVTAASPRGGAVQRLAAEAALTARGWSW